MCGKVSIVTSLLLISGVISLGGIISTGIMLINKLEEFKCGDLYLGLIVGVICLILYLSNVISLLLKCSGICSFIFSNLLLLFAIIYNFHKRHQLSNNCIDHYKSENLWDFYIYYMITLTSTMILFPVLIACIYKK